MKKNLHPQAHAVSHHCSSCNATFTVLSTVKQKEQTVEICSGCHPFYLGKSTLGKITGKAEKLLHKFEAGKKVAQSPTKKAPVKAPKKVKVQQTLSDLKA